MNIDTAYKWIDKKGYKDKRYCVFGCLDYFNNHNFTCKAVRVYTNNYRPVLNYLNKYKKSIVYTFNYNDGLSCHIITIYNTGDYDRLNEYNYYRRQSANECAEYLIFYNNRRKYNRQK